MSSKHYLIVSQYFRPEAFRINDLANGLIERGHKVTVLTGIPNYPKGKFFEGYSLFSFGREMYGEIEVLRVPLYPRMNGRGWNLILNYISFAIIASILAPFLCRKKYDYIIGFGLSPVMSIIPAVVLKKFTKTPLALWVQDLWPESLTAVGLKMPKFIMNSIRKLVDWIYHHCDKVFIQSFGFKEHVKAADVDDEKIIYLPNWAEEIYQPLEADNKFAKKEDLPDGFKVFFAGNIGKAQDFETILNAGILLKDFKDIHWVILGDGRQKKWVEKEVAKHNMGSTFHLLGRRPVGTMPHFFAHADVLLATLKKNPIFAMTIPSKVQSYLACGKPIVVNLEGSGAKVIEESKAGLIVSPEDPKGMADAILKLYKMDQKERETLGKNGHDYYLQNFERNKMINRIVDNSL